MPADHKDTLSRIISEHKKAEDVRRSHATNSYPAKFRDLVSKALNEGLSAQKIHKSTGVSLSTICSWRGLASESEDILCFEPVRHKALSSKGAQIAKVVLPSDIEILVPVALIKKQLLTWLSQDAA